MLQVCFVFRVYFGFTLHGAQRRTDCFDAAVIKVFKMSGYNKLNCELSYEDRLRAYGLQTLGRGAGGGGGGVSRKTFGLDLVEVKVPAKVFFTYYSADFI